MSSRSLHRCMPRGIPALVTLALCAAIFASTLPHAAAQPAKALPAKVAAFIPEAKQEGELVIFGQSLNPSQAQAVSQGFSAFYGFPIKLSLVTGLHVAKTAEVVDAAKHGVPSGLDIFWTTAENIERLGKGGALAAFDWTKALDLDPALKFSEYGLKSHDGVLSNVFYNTGLVKAADAPKSYKDLLDPKWRGRIAMPRSPGPWVNLTYALGEDETASLLEALIHQQQAKLLPTYPDVKARVISGEFPLGIGADVFIEAAKGAPVANADLAVTALAPWAFALLKDARHPALAKLWGYWAVSPEGQHLLDRLRGLALASSPGTYVAKYAKGKTVKIATFDYMAANSARLSQRYGQIMGIIR